MALLGTLTTGAGVVTVIAGQNQAEAMIVLGSVATANPLQGLQVEIDGTPYINVVNQPALLSAFFKWMVSFVSTLSGVVLKIATGNVPRSTTYRFTNNGATTPNIYAFSDNDDGVPILAATQQINASSYGDFSDFSALFIGTPANLTSAEIIFSNGRKATLTQFEVDALYNMKPYVPASEANGQLLAVSVIDNRDKSIKSVRLYCSAANTILIAKIPDAAFKALNK